MELELRVENVRLIYEAQVGVTDSIEGSIKIRSLSEFFTTLFLAFTLSIACNWALTTLDEPNWWWFLLGLPFIILLGGYRENVFSQNVGGAGEAIEKYCLQKLNEVLNGVSGAREEITSAGWDKRGIIGVMGKRLSDVAITYSSVGLKHQKYQTQARYTANTSVLVIAVAALSMSVTLEAVRGTLSLGRLPAPFYLGAVFAILSLTSLTVEEVLAAKAMGSMRSRHQMFEVLMQELSELCESLKMHRLASFTGDDRMDMTISQLLTSNRKRYRSMAVWLAFMAILIFLAVGVGVFETLKGKSSLLGAFLGIQITAMLAWGKNAAEVLIRRRTGTSCFANSRKAQLHLCVVVEEAVNLPPTGRSEQPSSKFNPYKIDTRVWESETRVNKVDFSDIEVGCLGEISLMKF